MIALEEAASAPVEQVGSKARALAQAHLRAMPVPAGVILAPSEEPSTVEVQAALGPGPYAVRSSSPVEDGEARSWAGQFTSRLPVDGAELVAAIEEVRASGSSARARAYGAVSGPIPVLIQPVIDAVCAGMAFTLDPSSGDERYCVVEAGSGLATDLADGQTTPARLRVEIETGRTTGDTDGPLSRTALKEVVALALEVAEWQGRPSDIEWAWDGQTVSLLQARPLTAASWHPAPGLWTSANLSETMPGIVSPMAASIILEDEFGRSIDAAAHRLRLAPEHQRLVEGRRFYGHAFWRVDRIKDRVLRLPGMVERKIDESMGIAPTYAGDGRQSGFTPAAVARALPVAHAMWRMFRHDGPRAQRFALALAASEAQWLAVDWDALAGAAFGEQLAALREVHRQTNRHAIGITFLAEQAHDFVRELLEVVGSSIDPPPNAPLLLAGLVGETMAAATWELERAAQECGDDATAILAARNADELPEAVAQRFRAAVAAFGWMAEADDELSLPRWDEEERTPFALFKAAVRALPSSEARAEYVLHLRVNEERRVLAASGAARPVLRRMLRLARRYQGLREELRVSVARANRLMRRALLSLGRSWTATGVLDAPRDVFWLTVSECDELLWGEMEAAAARAAVSSRKRHATRFRNWDPPRLLGSEPVAAAERSDTVRGVLKGVACSAGIARGRVAALDSLADVANVESGAILVLKHGSPGWTPAFVAAAGLVMEEGGLLAHSSVIARERGLPTVINVPRATELLRRGQLVEIDGSRGVVRLVDEEG